MQQARKRLVELLTDIDYATSKDPSRTWWDEDVTVGGISKNYSNYKYVYCINENYDGKNGVFYIDYGSVWSVFEKENNISYQQVKDLTQSTLGERYNFGDIATKGKTYRSYKPLGERYNY